jgi:catechol 2,3-dioxygenase-like lactoylglutathione lyase family enzyme
MAQAEIKELQRNVFLGLEHVGLYPAVLDQAAGLAAWYREVFGFRLVEGPGSYFLEGSGPGRIEVSKIETALACHLAIRVENFEEALKALEAQGIEYLSPTLLPEMKIAYLKQTDPAGNRVHLVWRQPA